MAADGDSVAQIGRVLSGLATGPLGKRAFGMRRLQNAPEIANGAHAGGPCMHQAPPHPAEWRGCAGLADE